MAHDRTVLFALSIVAIVAIVAVLTITSQAVFETSTTRVGAAYSKGVGDVAPTGGNGYTSFDLCDELPSNCVGECGDHLCRFPEDHTTCPEDCDEWGAICGDGICEWDNHENCYSCQQDCGECPDNQACLARERFLCRLRCVSTGFEVASMTCWEGSQYEECGCNCRCGRRRATGTGSDIIPSDNIFDIDQSNP